MKQKNLPRVSLGRFFYIHNGRTAMLHLFALHAATQTPEQLAVGSNQLA